MTITTIEIKTNQTLPTIDLSKTRLLPETEVLYRDPKKRTNTEGEGILCRVTSVIGEGKQRRYEIIDADPVKKTINSLFYRTFKLMVDIGPAHAIRPLPRICEPPSPDPASKQQHHVARLEQGEECTGAVPWYHDVLQGRGCCWVEGE
jgi:hypothetical protein